MRECSPGVQACDGERNVARQIRHFYVIVQLISVVIRYAFVLIRIRDLTVIVTFIAWPASSVTNVSGKDSYRCDNTFIFVLFVQSNSYDLCLRF